MENSSIETLDKIINTIFDSNNEKIHVEILLIDYGDKITINMKDEWKREVMKDIEKSYPHDNIKVSEVLGFNNIEYEINMQPSNWGLLIYIVKNIYLSEKWDCLLLGSYLVFMTKFF